MESTEGEPAERLYVVLHHFDKSGFQIKRKEKCETGTSSVTFLSYLIVKTVQEDF